MILNRSIEEMRTVFGLPPHPPRPDVEGWDGRGTITLGAVSYAPCDCEVCREWHAAQRAAALQDTAQFYAAQQARENPKP